MVIWTLAKKDLRLLVRDARAMIILLAMPLIFILVLGVSLGENFGQKSAAGLRITVLNLDAGVPRFFDRPAMLREGMSWLTIMPNHATGSAQVFTAASLASANHQTWFPHQSWSQMLLRDLNETADIRVEFVHSRAEAERLVRSGQRAAVLVLGKNFSKRIERCSFLSSGWHDHLTIAACFPQPGNPIALAMRCSFDEAQTAFPLYLHDGINPFHREGINLHSLDVEVMRDPTQETAAAIIDQVAQGSLLRVVMPWMIGRAFEKIGEPQFIDMLSNKKLDVPIFGVDLSTLLQTFPADQKKGLASGMQRSLQRLFPRYNLTAKTWAALTKEREITTDKSGKNSDYAIDGIGWLRRGGSRYQLLVPSYLVMFAFFLVLTVGWLFVAERRQGTMKRLVVAPLTKAEILIGKMLPCLFVSLFQGFFLLLAGKLVFGMNWGADPLWLLAVVSATSFAAMGLAMLVAALARTETQVAIYGTLLVLVLAGLSGCMMGDRALMPENMQQISRVTPHAWALDAYKQLLTNPRPEIETVGRACLVLTGFGAGLLGLAWGCLRLEGD
ncbi:MAG: ABC transporter permease [Planctomycetes bacterium]|nr:ABC transporter permease [Planctomycetota bacterium]